MAPIWDTWRNTAKSRGYPADDIIKALIAS
jgi:hypothetical protein